MYLHTYKEITFPAEFIYFWMVPLCTKCPDQLSIKSKVNRIYRENHVNSHKLFC